MKTLVIVEDHPVVRDMIIEMIQEIEPHENILSLHRFGNILELNQEPDLLVVDLNLSTDPEGEVRSPLKQFRKKFKNCKIIVFSGFIERLPFGLYEAAKINGVISKGSETDEISSGFRAVLEGKTYLCKVSKPHLESRGEFGDGSVSVVDRISKREFQIFQMLLDHHSEDDISGKLGLSRKTVSNHKHTIMKKLDIHSHAELVNFGRKQGF